MKRSKDRYELVEWVTKILTVLVRLILELSQLRR